MYVFNVGNRVVGSAQVLSPITQALQTAFFSINRRALDLCFVLINGSTVRTIIKELLWFLENCDVEFKSDVCSKIITAVEKYSPNKRWHVDTTMTVLRLVSSLALSYFRLYMLS